MTRSRGLRLSVLIFKIILDCYLNTHDPFEGIETQLPVVAACLAARI